MLSRSVPTIFHPINVVIQIPSESPRKRVYQGERYEILNKRHDEYAIFYKLTDNEISVSGLTKHIRVDKELV